MVDQDGSKINPQLTENSTWSCNMSCNGVTRSCSRVVVELQRVSRSCRGVAKSFAIFFAKNMQLLATLCNSTATPWNSIATSCNSCCNSVWSFQLVEGCPKYKSNPKKITKNNILTCQVNRISVTIKKLFLKKYQK